MLALVPTVSPQVQAIQLEGTGFLPPLGQSGFEGFYRAAGPHSMDSAFVCECL